MSVCTTLPRGATRTAKTHAVVTELVRGHGAKVVLDAACGTGTLAQALHALGLHVSCLDVAPDAVFPAGTRGIHADLNARLPLDDGAFEAIVCVEGVEHVENLHHLFREFARLLAPGGLAVVTTPNILSVRSRWKYFMTGRFAKFSDFVPAQDVKSPHVRGHINPVGYPEIDHALRLAGFRVEGVHANHLVHYGKLRAILARWLFGWLRPKHHPHHETLLRDELLFGENLIVAARKA